MAQPLTQAARDRLRDQARREQALAEHVLAAEARLEREIERRKALIEAQDRVVKKRLDDVADAVIAYVSADGVSMERAALILGRPKRELLRLVRGRQRGDDSAAPSNRHRNRGDPGGDQDG